MSIVPETALEVSDFDHWHELVCGSTVPVTSSIEPGVDFRGTLLQVGAADIALVRTRSVAQTVRRTARNCRGVDEPLVKVLVQRSGRALVEQRGRRGVLDGGSITVYDTSVPYTLSQLTPFHADAILVPRRLLPIDVDTMSAVQDRPITFDHGSGALLATYADACIDQLVGVSEGAKGRCVTALVDLLAATLIEHHTDAQSPSALRETALRFIDGHLDDPELSPTLVAASVGVSLRYLHRIFEGTGSTVANYIRTQRLQRVRSDLVDPRWSSLTTSAVGARWGLLDAAHLCRIFRKEFGCTPAEARNRADVRAV